MSYVPWPWYSYISDRLKRPNIRINAQIRDAFEYEELYLMLNKKKLATRHTNRIVDNMYHWVRYRESETPKFSGPSRNLSATPNDDHQATLHFTTG